MNNHLDNEKRAYRMALCTLTNGQRLEVEYKLLAEMKQRVLQAQMQFDKLGGQSRMDSIELCIEELENAMFAEMENTND
jgi:hypothetical protein